MIRVHVSAKGTKPLLMHSDRSMLLEDRGSRKLGQRPSPEEDAEKGAYRDEEGYLVVPARCIWACLAKAAKLFQSKTKMGFTISEMVKGSVAVEPELVRIKDKRGDMTSYEIFTTPVRIRGQRIPRSRPLIRDWLLDFDLRWNPLLYNLKPNTVKDILIQAGNVGLLDWRPTYGLFTIEKFEVVEE